MERYLRIELSDISKTEEVEEQIRDKGIEPLWTIAGEGSSEIGLPFSEEAKNILAALGIPFEEKLTEIDWNSQWSAFAGGDEKDGFFEVNFKEMGLDSEGSLKLKAGPGFGDLSHATTRLMLKMMATHCEGARCIDIGSGSGILSVAAALFGAKEVFACDIDPGAVQHTKECVSLNHLEEKVKVFLPAALWESLELSENPLILINMIEKEQREAMPVPFLDKFKSLTVISSGIITSDKDSYLKWMQTLGFSVMDSLEEEGWSAFLFKK